MEISQLAEEFRNKTKTREDYERIVKWCSENCEKMDLGDKDQKYLFDMTALYLMKMKIGNFSKDEAKIIVNYFSKLYATTFREGKDIVIKILEQPEYEERVSKVSNARCITAINGKSKIYYSENVLKQLMSKDTETFLRGLTTVFHEVEHAKQGSKIYSQDSENNICDNKLYLMAREKIVRQIYPEFYEKNYENFISEYLAEYRGTKLAVAMIRNYYKKDFLKDQDLDEFAREYLKASGKSNYELTKEVKFMDKTLDAHALINLIADGYVSKDPKIINEMPVLKFGYNLDGTRKEMTQLLQERADYIKENREIDIESINNLYETIVNCRENNRDVVDIYDYIINTGADDSFIFHLLENRLNKTNWTKEKIEQFIDETRKEAEQSRGEIELKREQEKSIKEEVGDEYKPKTSREEQEEKQVAVMWQNRFQSFDRATIKLPNSAKRKEQAVRMIKSFEKEKEQQEKENKEKQEDEIK